LFISTIVLSAVGFFGYAAECAGNVAVETGYCDRNITPLLETAAVKWGQYFSKIYGECSDGHIAIRMDSNGSSDTFNDVKKASYSFVKELALLFPLYTAKIEVFPAESEKSWHVIRWEAENGEIISYQEN
jgi:hypothetical protein